MEPDANPALKTIFDANAQLAELNAKMVTTRRQRATALKVLLAQGWTLADIGGQLGMSRQRVHQLLYGNKPATDKKGDLPDDESRRAS